MKLNKQQIKRELVKSALQELEFNETKAAVVGLEEIIDLFQIDTLFAPVTESAEAGTNKIERFLKKFPYIGKNYVGRPKTLSSTLIKLLHYEKTDINRLNDIIAFTILFKDRQTCYKLLKEAIEAGCTPYHKLSDTLHQEQGFATLNTTFYRGNVPFQLQIRAESQEGRLFGELSHSEYKKRELEKLQKKLKNPQEMEAATDRFFEVLENFRKGYDSLIDGKTPELGDILNLYSKEKTDYTGFEYFEPNSTSEKILLIQEIEFPPKTI